jgi:hypothetical protein
VRVFENMVLRIISGPKRDEVVVGLRKLYKEELRNLNFSCIIRKISQGGWERQGM